MPYTRRQVLVRGSLAAAALAVGATGGLRAGRPEDDSGHPLDVDVAVIGGGAAGTYCAWRLATSGPAAPSVALFEASARIGGRLWSQAVPPVTNQVAELGAMRIPADHDALLDLIGHLGLATMPFVAASADTLVRLRGTRIRRGDVTAAGQFPYDLPTQIARLSPDEIISLVLREVGIRGPIRSDGLESGPWLADLTYRGVPLSRMRAADLLHAILGREGAAFINAWNGFEFPTIAASTWVGLLGAITGPGFLAVEGGLQQLPLTLADRAAEAGASIVTGRTLLAIDDARGTGVTLRVANSTTGAPTTVRARSVILGLPASALRRLTRTSPALGASTALAQGLRHVVEIEATKAYLAYETPWWEALDLAPGRSVSDGSLRQTFYLPPDHAGRALLLASYALGDGASDLWGSSIPDQGYDGPTGTPPGLSRQLTAALSDLHGIEVPPPIDGRVHRWGHGTGGAAALWAEGIQPWDYWSRALTPVPGLPIHICGDALSMNQGWATGAMETAEAVLQDAYALSAPTWARSS